MVLGGMALLAAGVAAVAHATVRTLRVQFISNFTFVHVAHFQWRPHNLQ
jgi:hypothetical protein